MGRNPPPKYPKPPFPASRRSRQTIEKWFDGILDRLPDGDLRDRVLEEYGKFLEPGGFAAFVEAGESLPNQLQRDLELSGISA